jgi:hypothetical protein
MSRIKVARNFNLDEFVDPYTYFHQIDNGLSLIDDRLFDLAQFLRYLYGKPIYINNWWDYYQKYKDKYPIPYIIDKIEDSKRINKWSGLRTGRTSIGSPLSAHRTFDGGVCKAIDPKGSEIALYHLVKNNAEAFYKLGLRRLEDYNITKGWLHMDLLERNTTKNSIRVVGLTRVVRTIKF